MNEEIIFIINTSFNSFWVNWNENSEKSPLLRTRGNVFKLLVLLEQNCKISRFNLQLQYIKQKKQKILQFEDMEAVRDFC